MEEQGTESGAPFTKLYRWYENTPMYKEKRIYSEWEAYLWLTFYARFSDTPAFITHRGKSITWGKNQLPAPVRNLADAWKWSTGRVTRFLNKLKTYKMITIDKSQLIQVVTILAERGMIAFSQKVDTHYLGSIDTHYSARNPDGQGILFNDTTPMDTVKSGSIETVIETVIETLYKKEEKVNKDLYRGEFNFENFWEQYDKKVGDKNKLRKKWESLPKYQKLLIKDHLPLYKNARPEKRFRLNPETYLNQRGWENEIISNINNVHNGTNKTGYGSKHAPTIKPAGSFGKL